MESDPMTQWPLEVWTTWLRRSSCLPNRSIAVRRGSQGICRCRGFDSSCCICFNGLVVSLQEFVLLFVYLDIQALKDTYTCIMDSVHCICYTNSWKYYTMLCHTILDLYLYSCSVYVAFTTSRHWSLSISQASTWEVPGSFATGGPGLSWNVRWTEVDDGCFTVN